MYVKPEAAITVFELLMMGGVSPETCWAIKKHWNNKFYYTAASFWFFPWVLYYDARIHEHQVCYMPCPSHPPWFDHTLSNLILKILSFWNLMSSRWAVVAEVPKNLRAFIFRIKQGNNSYLYKNKSPFKFSVKCYVVMKECTQQHTN